MTYNEKLIENYIKGLKAISNCVMRETKGLEVLHEHSKRN